MTIEQLRELDAWIADHVMGWGMYKSGRGSICAHDSEGATHIIIANHPWDESEFQPTTDPAAAMMVLEKCAAREAGANFDGVQIDKIEGGYLVSTCNVEADAETLPLAICLFAKQLFATPTPVESR